MFFHGEFDFQVKTSRNIARKSKNEEILNFLKNRFFLASPAEPTDRPIGRPTDPNKIRGVWGGFAPPAIKIYFFMCFLYMLEAAGWTAQGARNLGAASWLVLGENKIGRAHV